MSGLTRWLWWRAETIMFPEAPLALRLSGQLVLGVVRVYYRQLEFLDDDAAAAFTKLLKVPPPPSFDYCCIPTPVALRGTRH